METAIQKIKDFCQDIENEFSVIGDEATNYQAGYISAIREIHELCEGIKPTKIKFKDAPIGSRFEFIGKKFVKVSDAGDGIICEWKGNVEGRQSFCCWNDEENGIDFETEIEVE